MIIIRAYISIILAAIFLAFVLLFVKLIGNSVPIMTLTFLRALISFLILLIIVPFIDKNFLNINKKDLINYAIIGLLLALSFSMYITALLNAPVSNVVLLAYVYPFFVTIFAYLYLKEKINKTILITLILAFIGIAIINPFNITYILGNSLALTQAVFYAMAVVYMRYEDKSHPVSTILWIMFFTTIFLLPFPFIYGAGNIFDKLIFIILLGLSSGLGYLFFTFGLEKLKATTASIILMIIEPMVAILLAIFILKEILRLNVIIGGAIILLAGIYLENHKRKFFKRER